MDMVNQILNIAAPPMTLIALLFTLPPLLIFRLLHFTIRSLFPEDVAGKVVLITGASSGIGEHVAYEYAKKGACLALVARRRQRLQQVAETARYLGSPDILVIPSLYKSSFLSYQNIGTHLALRGKEHAGKRINTARCSKVKLICACQDSYQQSSRNISPCRTITRLLGVNPQEAPEPFSAFGKHKPVDS